MKHEWELTIGDWHHHECYDRFLQMLRDLSIDIHQWEFDIGYGLRDEDNSEYVIVTYRPIRNCGWYIRMDVSYVTDDFITYDEGWEFNSFTMSDSLDTA